MADRTVSLRPVGIPPSSVASVLAGLTLSMQPVLGKQGVLSGVFMPPGTVRLDVVAVRPSCINKGRNGFQMLGIDAISTKTSPALDMVYLHTIGDGSDQQLPNKPVGQRPFAEPVSQGVSVFTDRIPKPAPAHGADGNLFLNAFGQVLNGGHA